MHFGVTFMLIIMSGNGACGSLNEMNVYSVFDSLTLSPRCSTSVEISNQYYSLYLQGRFKLHLLTHPIVGIVGKRNHCESVDSLRFGKPSGFIFSNFGKTNSQYWGLVCVCGKQRCCLLCRSTVLVLRILFRIANSRKSDCQIYNVDCDKSIEFLP